MRLIDVDALNLDYEVEMADDWKTAHEIANHVKYAPTIDAVPVVRCKDCEYYENGECVNPHIWMSDGAHFWPDEDFYCHYGERRNNDAD